MPDILRQIFYGDYIPFEILSERKVCGRTERGDVSERLKALAPDEHFKLIEQLLGDVYESQTEDMVKSFKEGVRFGVRFMMLTCLTNGSSGQEDTE